MATNLNVNELLQGNNTPFSSTESIFNKNSINKIITLFYLKNQILIEILINIVLLIVLLLLRQSLLNILLVIGLTNVILIISYIIIDFNIKNNIIKLNKDKKIYFYENFIVTFDKDNLNNSQNIILYKNISKALITKNYIFLKVNKTYLVISNNDVSDFKPKIISLLTNNKTKVVFLNKTKPRLKTLSYNETRIISFALFITSILAVAIMLLIFNILVLNDTYDFAPTVQVRFTWIFFIPIAIPIVTLIFGIKYRFRIGTIKNIIVGAITTAILLSFGSLYFIFAKGYDHNTSIIYDISNHQNFEFPDNYLIINEYHKDFQISYIKITNAKDAATFEMNMKSSFYWKKVENMPHDLNGAFEEFKDSFDFYCYYIKYNSNKLYSTGYVVVFYDLEKNLFQVFCIGVE